MGAKRSLVGFVLFRDPSPPRAEAFSALATAGFQIAKPRDASGAEWALDLSHERWGRARVGVMRGSGSAPPAAVFEPDDDLLPEDLTALRHARSSVLVEQKDGSDRPLSDRKRFLAVLAALARCGALMAVDMQSQKAWSHDALGEELASNADVDVTALYKLHAVSGGGHAPIWLHTHGLADLGLVDFDVLRAARQLLTLDDTAVRALAFAILEGRLRADGTPFSLASPEGDVALIPVSDFTLQAAPEDLALRDETSQEGHIEDRGVVCEVRLEELAPFLPAVPAGLLMQELRPEQTFQFSSAASRQMSARARATLGSALRAREAHPKLDLPLWVKIALTTSSGGLEHVWVRASLAGGEAIDGELLVQPHGVPGWSKGMRGRWSTDSVSGWRVQTPFGNATPHSFGPLRRLRANPEEARRRIARARARSPS